MLNQIRDMVGGIGVEHKRGKGNGSDHPWGRIVITIALSLLLITTGCRSEEKIVPKSEAEKISAYGITLTRESSPREVAHLLVKGLDNEDRELLSKLVAVKHEMEEVKNLFREYGRAYKGSPEKVAASVAAGWMATYLFFQSGQTAVTDERIEGDKASVYATGRKLNGEIRTLEIRMIREDGWWKVQAGLHEF